MYSFIKPYGNISFNMIFRSNLIFVDCFLLLSTYKFNIIS
jgi:hypothetical protein